MKPARTVLRVAAAIAGGVLLLLLAALAAVPPYLLRSKRLLRYVNEDPEKLRIDYASARSPWPGKIVVDGLEVRGSDPNVQWWFRMERAEIRVSLLDLPGMRFHATSVRATGLTFRLRQRLAERSRTRAAMAPLPPIPGFGEVPVKGGPSFAKPPEPPSQYWGVEIDDLVAAPATQIWIDAYRFDGQGRVAGGFLLRPRRTALVGPTTVDFEAGKLSVGGEVAASPFHARVEGRIATFDPRQVRGEEVYRFISGKASLSGEVPSVRFLNFFLGPTENPRLSGGTGTMRGGLDLDRGKGSLALTLVSRRVEAHYPKANLAGDATVRLRLSPWTPADASGRIDGSSIDLRAVSSGAGSGSRDWWGKFAIGPGTLQSRDRGLDLAARAALDARDARPLYTIFGVGLPKWAQGLARLEGVTATAAVHFGPSTLEVRDLAVRGGQFSVAGDYDRRGERADGAFLVASGKLAAGIEIRDGKSSIKLAAAKTWFANRGGPGGR